MTNRVAKFSACAPPERAPSNPVSLCTVCLKDWDACEAAQRCPRHAVKGASTPTLILIQTMLRPLAPERRRGALESFVRAVLPLAAAFLLLVTGPAHAAVPVQPAAPSSLRPDFLGFEQVQVITQTGAMRQHHYLGRPRGADLAGQGLLLSIGKAAAHPGPVDGVPGDGRVEQIGKQWEERPGQIQGVEAERGALLEQGEGRGHAPSISDLLPYVEQKGRWRRGLLHALLPRDLFSNRFIDEDADGYRARKVLVDPDRIVVFEAKAGVAARLKIALGAPSLGLGGGLHEVQHTTHERTDGRTDGGAQSGRPHFLCSVAPGPVSTGALLFFVAVLLAAGIVHHRRRPRRSPCLDLPRPAPRPAPALQLIPGEGQAGETRPPEPPPEDEAVHLVHVMPISPFGDETQAGTPRPRITGPCVPISVAAAPAAPRTDEPGRPLSWRLPPMAALLVLLFGGVAGAEVPSRLTPAAQLEAGLAALDAQRPEDAYTFCLQAGERQGPLEADALLCQARALLMQGQLALGRGLPFTAIGYCRRAGTLRTPLRRVALVCQGRAYLHDALSRPEEAARMARMAEQEDAGQDVEVRLLLGDALRQQGKCKEARPEYLWVLLRPLQERNAVAREGLRLCGGALPPPVAQRPGRQSRRRTPQFRPPRPPGGNRRLLRPAVPPQPAKVSP